MKNKSLFLLSLSFILLSCNNSTNIDSNNNNNNKENTTIENTSNNNVLISYFSCTSNTKKIATYINESITSTIYEIKPKNPYTSDDLNYNNTNSRAYKEQKNNSLRPEIDSNQINNFDSYDTIFLGYPIWFGQAPKIIYTFIESYNFENKTIIPFCTSGSSPIGSSATNLQKDINKGIWKEGRRFSSSVTKEEVSSWANSFISKKEEKMKLNNITFYVDNKKLNTSIEDNISTNDLLDKLKENEVNITLNKYSNFEQVGSLNFNLKNNHSTLTSLPGDIFLYLNNQIVLFYGTNTYSYTKLGHINLSDEDIKLLLDKDNVKLQIKLESN